MYRGEGFIKLISKYFIIIIAIISLIGFLLVYTKKYNYPPIRSDGVGYYSYLPAYIIYHDFSLTKLKKVLHEYYPSKEKDIPTWTGIRKHRTTKKYLNKYTIGESVMILPFFIFGHLLSIIFKYPADGFSLLYQLFVGLAGLFFISSLLVTISIPSSTG